MNIAIIPARGGSRRIPGKNYRLFHGKPILAYSIETAKASKLFEQIIVSTDDQHIVAVAKAYGAKVHMRPARFCEDQIGTQEVTRAVLNWWCVCHPKRIPEFVCCIYATAPMMLVKDLENGLRGFDVEWVNYTYPKDSDGKDAGQWYWGRSTAFQDGVPLEGNSKFLLLPDNRVCDINTEEDFQRAEAMYAALHEEIQQQ